MQQTIVPGGAFKECESTQPDCRQIATPHAKAQAASGQEQARRLIRKAPVRVPGANRAQPGISPDAFHNPMKLKTATPKTSALGEITTSRMALAFSFTTLLLQLNRHLTPIRPPVAV
jgi:hypothetical protein